MYEIEKFNPCEEALQFRSQFKTFEQAWKKCPRGDWMLWIAKELDVDLRILTKAKALCALTVRKLMKDKRSIEACKVALKFADGLATREELNIAAAAAYADAYAATYAADAAYADAYAATYAADAADAAAYAAYAADAADAAADAAAAYAADAAAAYAADAAADAADAADADAAAYAAAADAAYAAAAMKKNQMKTANICRKILTEAVFEKIKEHDPH